MVLPYLHVLIYVSFFKHSTATYFSGKYLTHQSDYSRLGQTIRYRSPSINCESLGTLITLFHQYHLSVSCLRLPLTSPNLAPPKLSSCRLPAIDSHEPQPHSSSEAQALQHLCHIKSPPHTQGFLSI